PLDEWKARLSEANENVIILCLSLHGGADAQGPFLWIMPTGTPPLDEKEYQKSRLRLSDVLDELKKLPEKKGKLLILDATQVSADWPNGMLHNDFPRGLKRLDSTIKGIDNLAVICASDDDERSWLSEERKKSIFMHFVQEAMNGGTGSDHVSALNL